MTFSLNVLVNGWGLRVSEFPPLAFLYIREDNAFPRHYNFCLR